MKIFSEAVCESIGSIILIIEILNTSLLREVFISWNGPTVHNASGLLKKSLERHFGGEKYRFTRFSSISRLKIHKTSKSSFEIERKNTILSIPHENFHLFYKLRRVSLPM
jgi:hypothetical protein